MADTLSLARQYHQLGMALLWLHPRSKRPVESGWTRGPRLDWEYLERTYRPGMNVGVRLGTPSKIQGRYLACIDVDIRAAEWKKPAERCLAELLESCGVDFALPEVVSGGGSGSRHLYFLSDQPFAQRTFAHHKKEWGVVAYSEGRQMVLPPSVHPESGKLYLWKKDRGLHGLRELDLSKEGTTADNKKEWTGEVLENFTVVVGAELLVAELSAPMQALLRDANVGDRSAALVPATRALLSAGASPEEILTVLTDPKLGLSRCAYDHVGCNDRRRAAEWLWRYTVERLVRESRAVGIFEPVSPLIKEGTAQQALAGAALEAQNAELETEAWKNGLHRNPNGTLKGDITNVEMLLEKEIGAEVFRLNNFSNQLIFGVKTRWGNRTGDAVTDKDIYNIQSWLCASFEINVAPPLIWSAAIVIGGKNRFHPVRDYLRGLEWDGQPRIDTWLRDYVSAGMEEPYLTEVSRKFLLAAVARVFEPGIKFDHILVLEGKQGIGKSTVPSILASPRWFAGSLPNIRDKDALIALQGTWFIEISELATLRAVDKESYKAFFSASTDKFRVPYGRASEEFPRQCVFVGTTNHSDYLSDNTGNRRFWPVKVGRCQFKALTRDRDQLWAEARVLWETFREDLHLTGVVHQQALEVQESRVEENEEAQMIDQLGNFIQGQLTKPEEERFDFTSFKLEDLFAVDGPFAAIPKKNYQLQLAGRALRARGFTKYGSMGLSKWRSLSTVIPCKHPKRPEERE